MPITVKCNLQSIAKTPVDKVLEAVSKAQATGEDPYLAGIAAKTEMAADEAVMDGVESTPAPSSDVPPWEATPDNQQDPQEALRDFVEVGEGAIEKLFLVSRETQQEYEVLSYDPETRKAKLLSPTGLTLFPSLGERETKKYFPVWR